MKKSFKLFCFGFGQVAKYFITNLISENPDLKITATNTSKTQIKNIGNFKFKSFFFNNEKYDHDLIDELKSSNLILISIPPINKKDLVLKLFEKEIKNSDFKWLTYLSATSVYGDKKGNWVDETSTPNPKSEKGKARLFAEKQWLRLFEQHKTPIQIFRLSGIYSQENNILFRMQKGTFKIVNKKDHFFSRIHVEDIANILKLSLTKFKSGEIYNISDDMPCSNVEIANFASNLTKISLPQLIEPDEIKSEILENFYKDSKKVSNNKIKEVFSYKLKFPTYKEGLRAIFNNFT